MNGQTASPPSAPALAAAGHTLSTAEPVLSILIVNWNTRQDLLDCLASVYAAEGPHAFEVIVFDNASTDGSAAAVAACFPQVRVVAGTENIGFARANNRAAREARGAFWLLLNPDAIVHPGAIEHLLAFLEGRPDVAAVGPRLLNPDGSLQPSIERLPTLFGEWWRLFHLNRLYPVSHYPAMVLRSRQPRRVEVLNGACLLLRREALDGQPLFDEAYFVYSEEVDLCDRLRDAGWVLHWVPEAVVTHRGGQSTRQAADRMFLELYRNKLLFFRKRRGPAAARAYKVILFQAAVVRCLGGWLARVLPLRKRVGWASLGRQYALLLRALPSM
jgi:GT2 family glycosyltransferase